MGKRRPPISTLTSSVAFELGDRIGEQPGQLCRVEGRADRGHRDGFRDLGCGGKDRGAAEAVSDEDLRGRVRDRRSMSAARTMSSTFDEKLVLANSPSLAPSPVKSNRRTPIPRSTRPRVIRVAAGISFEHVKQCTNSAYATGSA